MRFLDKKELKLRKNEENVKNINLLNDMNKRISFDNTLDYQEKYPNIFIFGLQRSGTTLLSQLIAKNSDIGYINNLTAKFWENPQYGIAISKSLGLYNNQNISLSSTHGNTSDIDNLHEFGYFWAGLLNQKSNPNLANRNVDDIDWSLLKNKIISINDIFQNACVFKNTLIGHYLKGFSNLFKYSIYIYIKRDYLDIAMSILKVRKERYGDINCWWSMKPKEYDRIKNLEVHEQIIAQIFYLEQDIEEQIKYLQDCQLIIINYKDLCKNPINEFQKIATKLKLFGFDFKYNLNDVPLAYKEMDTNTEDTIKFNKYIKKYWGNDTKVKLLRVLERDYNE